MLTARMLGLIGALKETVADRLNGTVLNDGAIRPTHDASRREIWKVCSWPTTRFSSVSSSFERAW